ncbi:MAG: hypothetical protein IK100_09950, partial [Muribaculaceae bacterium]|nr:hypothetical protein [Muribaculaceae bacterium]
QEFFDYESEDLKRSIMGFTDSLKIEIDLSSLIEYLPKDKTEENRQKAAEVRAQKEAEEARDLKAAEEAASKITPAPSVY